jgi:hypothetical protein
MTGQQWSRVHYDRISPDTSWSDAFYLRAHRVGHRLLQVADQLERQRLEPRFERWSRITFREGFSAGAPGAVGRPA